MAGIDSSYGSVSPERSIPDFGEGLLRIVPKNQDRAFFRSLLKYPNSMMARFIRAQLKFASLGLIAYTGFLLIAGFPYALAVGAIAGILEFIPFIGPLIGFILIVGMAILTGYPHWLMVFVFLILWRGIQDYVMSPYLMGHGMKLHPLAVIVGVLAGGEIAGVAGMFLAVPVLGSLRVIWTAWRLGRNYNFPAGERTLGSPSSIIRSDASESVNGIFGSVSVPPLPRKLFVSGFRRALFCFGNKLLRLHDGFVFFRVCIALDFSSFTCVWHALTMGDSE